MSFSTYEFRLKIDGGGALLRADHEVLYFPGGEAHIKFGAFTSSTQIAFVQGGSGDTIMALAQWADGVRRKGLTSIAVIPYLPAARADRGSPLGAKVYADLINSMKIDRVIALDPHSDVAPALYDRLTVVPLEALPHWSARLREYDAIIAPDLGAHKRAAAVAALANLPVIQASKKRDFGSGHLSGFECEPLDPHASYLIVDDICDGGGTFLGLASVLDHDPESLGLWTTHGIYSKGTNALREKFGYIGCTDSHDAYDWNAVVDHVTVEPILKTLISTVKDF